MITEFESKKDADGNAQDSNTLQVTATEIESGKPMALLSYLIPVIPYLKESKNKFVMFHAKQGMNLFSTLVIYVIVYSILTNVIKVGRSVYRGGLTVRVTPWWITFPLGVVGLLLLIMDITALTWAWNGEVKELPIVRNIKIFK